MTGVATTIAGGGLACRRRDLAGLDETLETPERLLREDVWHDAKELRRRFPKSTDGRHKAEAKVYFGPPSARRRTKAQHPFVGYQRSVERHPAQALAGMVFDDPGIPLESPPKGAPDYPMSAALTGRRYLGEVPHDP
jgi:hypothetical protein